LIARTLMVLADHPTVVVAGHAAAEVQGTRDDLRRAIAGHARLTRRMGDPAEQVVLAVKTAAEEALDDLWAATGRRARMHLPALRADLVRWTIDAYYDTGDGEAPAP
jgi:hypothetical protein